MRQKRLGHALQAVPRQDGVGVHPAKQGVSGGVDASVQRIGLAAVLFVNDAQVGVLHGAVGAAYRLGGQTASRCLWKRQQDKLAFEYLQGVIAGTVVDHHDFEIGISQLEHGTDRGDDGRLFVVGRYQQADARFQTGEDLGQALQQLFLVVTMERKDRQQVQCKVTDVEQNEIAKNEPGRPLNHVANPPEPVLASRSAKT